MSVNTTLAHGAIQQLHMVLDIVGKLDDLKWQENMLIELADFIADLEDYIQEVKDGGQQSRPTPTSGD